ncbi:helix-turn-helix domain-containing protein [Lacticaseibacillus daqingensis]|uniref:helix-turn-helix domain-containing protein n=1 Tax=Lacticaseibacillus daqingensis TaxID=2486014 RepID=UPI000F7A5DF3|nr:helix-turn-helix transcriptional regulator [Lacticaseibacillus daqingensis]
MTEAIAYRLKQIMTTEHLSLTQAAKLIGISPSSMRKVLKDTPMSRPIMFKINRFIDEHATTTEPHSFTIFDSEAAVTQQDQAEAKRQKAAAEPADAPKANRRRNSRQTSDAAKTPNKRQPRQAQATPVEPAANTRGKQATKADTPTKAQPTGKKANQAAETSAKAPRQANNSTEQAAKAMRQAAKADQQAKPNKRRTKTDSQAKAADQPAQLNEKVSQPANQTNQRPAKAAPAKQQNQAAPKAEQQPKQTQPAVKPGRQAKQQPQAAPKAAQQAKQNQPTQKADQQTKQNQSASKAERQTKPRQDAQKADQQAKQPNQSTPKADQQTKQNQPAAKAAPQPKQPRQSAKKAVPQPQQPNQSTQAPAPQAKPSQPAPKPDQQAKPQNQSGATPAPQAAQATTTTTVQPASVTLSAPAAMPVAKPIGVVPVAPKQGRQTIQIFMDESFSGGSDYQRNMSIGATVIDPNNAQALDGFTNTLYPFGWQPGDEVKARGKSSAQISTMLGRAHNDAVQVYAVHSPLSDAGNFSLSFGIMYPYVAAILRIIDAQTALPAKVRVTLDNRSEIDTQQLGMAARMLHAYVKAQTSHDVAFFFRTADSKDTIGVQYSDFVSHAAVFFTKAQMATSGIQRLADIGSQLGDQTTLFAMVGLQKDLLDERPTAVRATTYKNPVLNAALRMFNLATKAATMTQVPDETFTQAKLVITQLLQIVPSSVNGGINKLPFQNWYDMCARATSFLHYTDESLPEFDIDPDAMQIVTDALNNIASLLAGGR